MVRPRRATAAPAPAATVTMTPVAMRQAIAEGVNAILDERAAAQQAQNGGIGEGNPSKRELGESSASLPKILPVTGEPIHHTIPLLATRIARHEDRLNDIVNVINGLPCGHITEDVNNLIIGQMAVESKVEQIKTEFSESMEFIAALCSANVTMGDVLTSFDHELEQISAQNFSLRRAIQESYARERTRDRTIETLTTKITEFQRSMDEVSGKP
ncbi:hypothetical protein CTI12_AA451040 [Artemisia annua]|uniref:Uncharacterized protein n=1 Tax=Artemisia annua TaxID=35608 RepID=A0A2U1LUJ7_ARTAN|nr:hypothetical protein CTI12_AA451040 [Artemisia annua]